MITITERLKKTNPITAEFCQIINEVLKNRPNMSLAEFAEQLDEAQKEGELRRVSCIVGEQLREIQTEVCK